MELERSIFFNIKGCFDSGGVLRLFPVTVLVAIGGVVGGVCREGGSSFKAVAVGRSRSSRGFNSDVCKTGLLRTHFSFTFVALDSEDGRTVSQASSGSTRYF